MGIVKSNNGFSLLEVMLAAGIGAVLLGVFSISFVNQIKSSNFMEDRLSRFDFKQHLEIKFSDANVCLNSFRSVRVNNIPTITQLLDENNELLYSSDETSDRNSYDHLQLDSFELANLNVPTAAAGTGAMVLTLDIEREREGGGPSTLKPVEVVLRVTVNGAGRVTACSSINSLTQGDLSQSCVYSVKTLDSGRNGRARGHYSNEPLKIYGPGEQISTYNIEEPNCGLHCTNTVTVYRDLLECQDRNFVTIDRRVFRRFNGTINDGPDGTGL